MGYREDRRSRKQFKQDIKEGTKTESEIIHMYVEYFEEQYGLLVNVTDNGCDNSGKYIPADQVKATADYLLNGRPVEVKFNKEKLPYFHFKKQQLKTYLDQGAVVLWVNGWDTKRPRFTIFKRRHLLNIQKQAEIVSLKTWGGKKCYRLYADDYNWHAF